MRAGTLIGTIYLPMGIRLKFEEPKEIVEEKNITDTIETLEQKNEETLEMKPEPASIETLDIELPATKIYKKDKLKVVIRLNAPIVTHSSFTITVIVSGEQEKEWNFSVEKDEKILEMFDVFFSYYYNKGA